MIYIIKYHFLFFIFYVLAFTHPVFGQTDTVTTVVSPGWEMISLPFIVPDSRKSVLYPHAVSDAFGFNGTYIPIDTLQNGFGYWINFSNPDTISFVGTRMVEDSLYVVSGWNLISAFSFGEVQEKIYPIPENIINSKFLTYNRNSGYLVTDSLLPGKAYWVEVDAPGTLSASRWELLGLENEEITAIGLHPSDSKIIYAGSTPDVYTGRKGKILKSINEGTSWDTLLAGSSYLSIQLNPFYPETVYVLNYAIIKTTNGGMTWQLIVDSIDLSEKMVDCLTIDQDNPEILYAGTCGFYLGGGSFYKSYNGGLSWIDLQSTHIKLRRGVLSVAIDPKNSNILYVGTGDGSILKSTTGGDSWIVTGFSETGKGIYDILIDPRDSKIIIAAINSGGFVKSTNGGNNWIDLIDGLPNVRMAGVKVKINPYNYDLFCVASFEQGGIYRMKDQMKIWDKIGIARLRNAYYYCDLVISQDANRMYFGGKGGVFRLIIE
jgi:photosystem II stability/assembly factor-like uncharacterized protein